MIFENDSGMKNAMDKGEDKIKKKRIEKEKKEEGR